MTSPRLRDYALGLAAERFIGREQELAAAELVLTPSARSRVLYVHGPGGVGKSAFVRELARRAQLAGAWVVLADGRALAADPGAIGEMVAGAAGGSPLVVLDEADSLGPGVLALRERVFALLPADGRVVLAGRSPLDRSWGTGLDGLVAEIQLRPLDGAAARELLISQGVAVGARLEEILSWAGGSPLALTVAARSVASGRTGSPLDVGDKLVRHLANRELDGIDPAFLDVAALCWAVDDRLIAAALPGHPTRGALDQLRALSVVEQVGHRVSLHPLLAEAIRAKMRADAPDRYRTMRRRIADNLTARSVGGDMVALHELTNLIENPLVRQGAGLDPSRTHAASPFRPEDASEAASDPTIAGGPWWSLVEPWLRATPHHVTAVHRLDGSLAALAACVPAAKIGDQPHDPHLGEIARYIADHGLDRERTLVAVAPHSPAPTDHAESIELIRVANAVMIARTGITNPRWLFAPLWAGPGLPADFFRSFGYVPVPSLARRIGDRDVEWWLADFGPGGLIGRAAAIVAAETGGTPSALVSDRADLLVSLYNLRDGTRVAARVAQGTPTDGTHEAACRELRGKLAAILGGDDEGRAALNLLVLTYLEPGMGENAILERLHVGRTTYYRMLRNAKERLLTSDTAELVSPSA